MTHQQQMDRMLAEHPALSPQEKQNIRRALDVGRAHGYGNVMAWLATEWALMLVGEGLPEETAVGLASTVTPYQLPHKIAAGS